MTICVFKIFSSSFNTKNYFYDKFVSQFLSIVDLKVTEDFAFYQYLR